MTAKNMVRIVRDEVSRRAVEQRPFLIAIDGRCAAGKSTLARALGEIMGCPVIHMDDFFLRPEQRTAERYAQPGGNVDRERFAAEVLRPLRAGQAFSYRPFDCHAMALGEPVPVPAGAVTVVEGTYSCHPALRDGCDLRIFLTVSPEEQRRRIERRNGADAETFLRRWIPLEEQYFRAFSVAERCDLRFTT